jgi:uncharacterized protein (TIGR02147 family)
MLFEWRSEGNFINNDVAMTDIYTYLDYSRWLAAAYKQKKAEMPVFSHRYISQRLGLKSSGYILYVMQGKRKLTESMAIGLAQLFKLTKPQTDYFLQLLRYTHAKTSDEKQFHFQRLISLRRKQVKNVLPDHYRLYEKWYYPVVREALALQQFTGDYAALASMIIPSITAAEAAEAIELLTELQFIGRDDDGVFYKKDAVISTGDVWQSAVIHAHQLKLISMGADALEEVPKSHRDISNLTITASEATLELIAQRIAHLRTEILELARCDKSPDRVLQCNFMVFPSAMKQGDRS